MSKFEKHAKSLEYFNDNFHDEDAKYWAISDYLISLLNDLKKYNSKENEPLIEFIREYTIKKVGLDPLYQ